MNKTETIRQKCIEANPSILDLKFGCELIYKGLHYYYIREHINAGHCCLRGYERTIVGEENFKTFESAFLKILGRPIRLADVLLAIQQKDADLEKKFTEEYNGHPPIKYNKFYQFMQTITAQGMGLKENKKWWWNLLEDDITKQSPETIDFIYELIK